MNLDYYENLPETLEKTVVENLCIDFFSVSQSDSSEEFLEIVDILSDKQWHTYELPSDKLASFMDCWLTKYCEKVDYSADVVLKITYCFGLNKKFFNMVSEKYGVGELGDYQEDLSRSEGENIDPYWSMS